ncbi:MAG TPA: hypothetical protein VLX90_16815 [Steroidobacteraceae bacterium]|nr:hypothetical protein [Steroidobacteraceae bacterium]
MKRREFISAAVAAAVASRGAVGQAVPNAPVLSIGGGSAPGVTGPIADGNTVTISYDGSNGFGANGPGSTASIYLFDNCSTYTGAVGSVIPTNPNTLGVGTVTYTYSGVADPTPLWLIDPNGRIPGRNCALTTHITQAERVTTGGARINRILTPATSEWYICRSYKWVQVPTYSGSFWKTTWYTQGPYPSSEFEMIAPSFNEGENFACFGGSAYGIWPTNGIPGFGITASIDTTGGWNTWESYYSINPVRSSADSVFFRSTCKNKNTDTGMSSNTAAAKYPGIYVDHLNIPGWNGDANDSRIQGNMQVDLADLYICGSSGLGQGACARVMIGNASTLAACTDLAICTPTAWSNGSITCIIRCGGFQSMSGKYLFVLNASNNVVTYNGSQGRLIS